MNEILLIKHECRSSSHYISKPRKLTCIGEALAKLGVFENVKVKTRVFN